MKKYIYLLLIIFIIFSCGKFKKKKITDDNNSSSSSSQNKDQNDNGNFGMDDSLNPLSTEELEKIISKLSKSDNIKKKKIKEAKYGISNSYQNDSLEFKSLVTDIWEDSKIAIVGTDGVSLYTDTTGSSAITIIPKGTIIILHQEYKQDSYDDDFGDYYQHNDEYNYWYETDYEGKTGFVFGSYLVTPESFHLVSGEEQSPFGYNHRPSNDSINEKLIRLGYYYTKNTKSDLFYDFNGTVKIPEKIQRSLINDKFTLQKVKKSEFFLNANNPDDMVALYKNLHSDKMAATYITTDFLIHNLHLLFDKMLEDTETKIMFPLVKMLIEEYYKKLEEYESNTKDDETVLKESIQMMKKYFMVAGDLAGMSIENKSIYPEDVKKELDLIKKAEGFGEAPIFKYKEDYSQFKPRGHYTKSEILKKYFKTMMWFGRLHFYCVTDRSPDEDKAALKLTPAALLLVKIAKENKNIYNIWKALFQPISYIVGEADDYTMDQYFSILDEVDLDNFGEWVNDENNIKKFIKKANKELKGPKISGNSLLENMKIVLEDPGAPQGFRLFGQRFTFDSFIHNRLSTPRVGDPEKQRLMVKGIDIMSVFGNTTADEMLAFDREEYINFTENHKSLTDVVNNFETYDWRKTFFNSYLKIIKETATFDNTMPFYFTQSEKWDKKALLTSHGAWAELRHDTILYVKQSYAELAGKGPEKTWVVDQVERPIGYVEPNLDSLYWIQSILDDAVVMLVNNGFMSETYKYKYLDYKEILDNLVTIVEKEANDKSISYEENEFIYSVPDKIAGIIMPDSDPGAYLEEKDLQMAIVADVHTDSINRQVLEVATGIPYRIYVALNDNDGGKRIAEGYTYSYYEFTQPMSDRLNDDQWREKIYNNDKTVLDEVDSKRPQWFIDIVTE